MYYTNISSQAKCSGFSSRPGNRFKVRVSSEPTMYHGHITDEAFVLASLKEFVKLWGSGSQASLQLECEKGKACIKFSCQLGAPADLHFVPHVQQDAPHGFHGQHLPHHCRHKGPSQQKRDRARAATHRARQNAAAAS